jgi:hypothetical protein
MTRGEGAAGDVVPARPDDLIIPRCPPPPLIRTPEVIPHALAPLRPRIRTQHTRPCVRPSLRLTFVPLAADCRIGARAPKRLWAGGLSEGVFVNLYFLVGAILGSGFAIAFCAEPAQRLVNYVQTRIGRERG